MPQDSTGPGCPWRLICLHPTPESYPLGVGICLAYAQKSLDPEKFDFGPWFPSNEKELEGAMDPSFKNVILASNYFWCLDLNLDLSRLAKDLDPDSIVIHGGPSTPGYPGAMEMFLTENPWVDFAVFGEGELALAELLEALAEDRLTDAPPAGVAWLRSGRMFRTPARASVTDVNLFPSPYLTGLFDDLSPERVETATVETNRGCPYSCAYCSWTDPEDQSSRSGLRLFDLARVEAELDWVAFRKIPRLFIADANFGIHPRDERIARVVADTKTRCQSPRILTVNYAKNINQRLIRIIDILDEVDIDSQGGLIAIQTRDKATLEAVGRKNIPTREYDKLREVFGKKGYPLTIVLMLGLPGADGRSFRADLDYYFDQIVDVTFFRTLMLPNSPMADPDFRRQYGLVVDRDGFVLATSLLPREQMDLVQVMARGFNAVHNLGVLRWPLVWLKTHCGLDPIRVLEDMILDPQSRELFPELADPDPTPQTTVIHPYFSSKRNRECYDWTGLGDRFFRWASQKADLTRFRSMATLLKAQAALMPREHFAPTRVELDHDVVAWYSDLRQGHSRPLDDYGPARLEIKEPCYFWRRWWQKHRPRPSFES